MKNKTRILAILIGSIFLSISFAVILLIKEIKKPQLPILGEVKDFILTDSHGKPFNSRILNGKVWIANFFFTTCGDVCPITTKAMANLNRTFEQVHKIKLVSISVNPEHDTPEVLNSYAQKIKGKKKNWYFLTGERETISDIALDGFKLGSVEEPVFHSTSFPLIDRYGYIRGYYDGTKDEEVNKLFKDAAALLKDE